MFSCLFCSTSYHPQARVEVIGNEPGMENSLYEATALLLIPRKVQIVYETLDDDDEGEPLIELANFENIRPYPSPVLVDFLPGDDVDVWFHDGWWRGTYDHHEPENDEDGLIHCVRFDYMPEGEQMGMYRMEHVRLHQEFNFQDPLNFIGIWTYNKM